MVARTLALLLLVACSSDEEHDTDAHGHTDTFPTPTVTIIGPLAPVSGPDVTIEVEVTDFLLNDVAQLEPRRSPLRWVADALIPPALADSPGEEPNGVVVIYLDGVERARAPELSFTLTDVDADVYELKAELRWSDNHPFFPSVEDTISLEVVAR